MAVIFRLGQGLRLVLASSSPRRQQLLSSLGIPFTVHNSGKHEPAPAINENPEAYAARAALSKGHECLERLRLSTEGSFVILAADTIVHMDNQILGKPGNSVSALAMLKMLNGRRHHVITAVYLAWTGKENEKISETVFSESSEVTFADWADDILEAYVASEESLDKAGAYAVQGDGAFLISRLMGSWTNVVGLPMTALTKKLLMHNLIEPV